MAVNTQTVLWQRPSLGILRVALGLIFFWAFMDKMFGLGFATQPEKSWIQGVSPTTGFLTFGTHGIFAPFFQALAGNPLIDWLFMLGILLIGLALLLGVGIRVAAYSGSLLMFLMYLSAFPPANHPFLDEHIIYICSLIVLETCNAGDYFGLGRKWKKLPLVKRYPILA